MNSHVCAYASCAMLFCIEIGTPTESDWPAMTSLPTYTAFEMVAGKSMKEVFPAATEDTVDLLSHMLQLNPSKRITAAAALQHRFFSTAPTATPPAQLPKLKGPPPAPGVL